MALDKEEKKLNAQLSCGTSFGSKSFQRLIEICLTYAARLRYGKIFGAGSKEPKRKRISFSRLFRVKKGNNRQSILTGIFDRNERCWDCWHHYLQDVCGPSHVHCVVRHARFLLEAQYLSSLIHGKRLFSKARGAIARVGLSLFLSLSTNKSLTKYANELVFISLFSPFGNCWLNKQESFFFFLFVHCGVRVMLTRRSQALHGSSSRGLSPYSFITIHLVLIQFKLERFSLGIYSSVTIYTVNQLSLRFSIFPRCMLMFPWNTKKTTKNFEFIYL